MVSDNVPHDQSGDQPSAILIPVQVDQLVAIARDLAGFIGDSRCCRHRRSNVCRRGAHSDPDQ
jgi:hypothetical protein